MGSLAKKPSHGEAACREWRTPIEAKEGRHDYHARGCELERHPCPGLRDQDQRVCLC